MVDAMGIARLLAIQQPGNTHGIYRYGPRAHIGTPNALLMPMGLLDLSRRYADKTNHQSLITDY
jgi:hypothetical protein